MKTPLILLVSSLLLITSCSHQKAREPRNLSAHKPVEDQYWNDLALESVEQETKVMGLLKDHNLNLYNQIQRDSKDPYLPMFWGQSLNFDSNAKKKIVEEDIIDELQARFNIQNDNNVVHAGVMHTYGYLFSTIDTPYGYKRKRWIAPTLNLAFGLRGNGFSPNAPEGGLLSNVTYFSGMLAFKNKSELSLLKNVSNEVFTYDFMKLARERLEEVLRDYTLVTTLVPFPIKKSGEPNEYLLIYSTIDHRDQKELLITAFPVDAESYRKIVAPESLGPNQKITLRYNAYLEGFGKNLTGTRKLIKN